MVKKSRILIIILVVLFMGVFVGIKPPTPLFDLDYSTVVKDKDGKILRVFLNDNEQWRMKGQEEEVPYKLKTAIINFEDKRFYKHYGLDFTAFSRAIFQNISKRRKISGASTITMQVARLSKEKQRTIINKIIEMIQAFKIEMQYTKDDILKFYVNNAPYGGNIIGYRAATYRYFGKEATMLTWSESALLAVLPNSPSLINPNRGRKKLKIKRDRLLKKLYEINVIDKDTYLMALKEEIPKGQLDFPLYAPHFAREIYKTHKYQEINTSIDIDKQKEINRIVKNYNKIMERKGIYNLAVIVAEKESGKVRAYIGSQDFSENENSGKINGVEIKKSSGSILKPFLYALAIDDGIISTESLMEDIPINYGAYSPYNANKEFMGLVKANEALTRSLNAPAVRLLEEYSVDRFYDFLIDAGLTTLFRNAKSYGLPLILGGAEVKLSEILTLYRGLGNYGEFSDLKYIENNKKNETKKLISKGASYLVLDILKSVKRPGLNYYWEEYDSNWDFSWKTGTSYGNRDAWAVGLSNEWVIGVWVGNFSGKGEEGVSGIGAAAPLLFRIFNYLPKSRGNNDFEMPKEELKKVELSKLTAYRLDEEEKELSETKEFFLPKNAKALKKSPYEKIIYVNEDETEKLCSLCWEGEKIHKILKEEYPPDVLQYMSSKNLIKKKEIKHRKTCINAGQNRKLDFTYPKDKTVVYLPKGLEGIKGMTCTLSYSDSESKIYWYIDGVYNGFTKGINEKVLVLESGWHKIFVSDELGNNNSINFYVRSAN